ncbi:hypothetical protein Q6D62_03550 [Corynebacterium diphtheriae]|uniref:hypothetical protein n=1 Tax=Corynebacterium diphtheriae TaxID=1717 RepID=UPI0002468EA1|nr:hypothetical protein [Corynebacterium diphtheriae]AEX69383.1 hypothetical protein CDPW8_0727 [Corynebacterium diphtheriae PW8]UEB38121.1 hypothetical protein LK425_06585 [Corynebacterium diphtheriae]WLF43421.1 hypothetical protein Q6D62_03550 [Corynebacterium diphtheriae]CAB0497745.1 hypothetical protein CIP100161_00608 [Corynebacterium diphtheriae]CAB0590014.1 hypothetical protein CIP107554_00680 [Corynebacterium diphtheriae]
MNQGGLISLSPHAQVLLRPEGIQFGLDSATAGIFAAPESLIVAIVQVLRGFWQPIAKTTAIEQLTEAGLQPVAARGLIDDLLHHRVLSIVERNLTVAAGGFGPLVAPIKAVLGSAGISVVQAHTIQRCMALESLLSREVPLIWINSTPSFSHIAQELVEVKTMIPVGLMDNHAIIGPVRIDGRGPCGLCTDLYRSDADPQWPALLKNATAPLTAPAALTYATAARVTRLVEQLSEPRQRVTVTAGLVIRVSPDGELSSEIMSPHSRCPLCWSSRWDCDPLTGTEQAFLADLGQNVLL